MKRTITVAVFLTVILGVVAASTASAKKIITDYDAYFKQYPYMTYRGAALTFDSEFEWPEGYDRLDSAQLSPYQYWISFLPLWNPARPVGATKVGILYNPDQITRPINLPWRSTGFFDYIIPIQLKAEFDIATKTPFDFVIKQKKGVDLKFKEWLEGDIVFNARDSLYFVPAKEKREANNTEFNRFFGLVTQRSTYASLVDNCKPVADTNLRPGDMYIAHDEGGLNGKVYVVMCVIQNKEGDRKYIVATGGSDPCDFYIPLFSDRKDYPWISLDQVKALITDEYPTKGFYRFSDM